MTMAWAAGISAGSGVLSSIMGSNAAEEAAAEQAAATRYAADIQKQMFDTQNQQFAPYRGMGYQGLNLLGQFLSGPTNVYNAQGQVTGQQEGTGFLTQQFTPDMFQRYKDPSYDFMLNQGLGSLTQRMAVGGGGSNRDIARTRFAEDYAKTGYSNAFDRFTAQQNNLYNRLAGIVNIGSGAQSQVANLSQGTASNLGQLAVAGANAMAGGYLGSANAMQGGLNAIGNAGMMYGMYKSGLNPLTGGKV